MQLSPVAVVAEHYGLTPRALISGIERGTLQGIKIKGAWLTAIALVDQAIAGEYPLARGR